ncbi:UNVERIFIED_CONTAM: hypothetical protein RMT77_005096 [Armadillidium vulgare]
MHVVQVFIGYDLVNKNIMLRDEEVEFDESDNKDDKNIYTVTDGFGMEEEEEKDDKKINDGDMGKIKHNEKEKNEDELVLKENHSNIEENIDFKNIIISDNFDNFHDIDNFDAEIKKFSYGNNIF